MRLKPWEAVIGIRGPSALASLVTCIGLASCVSFPEPFATKGDGKVTRTTQGDCLNLNPESALHPVGVCAFDDRYEFIIRDERLSFAKDVYRRRVKEKLYYFLKETPYPIATLSQSEVQVWMIAPAFRPAKASLVFVLVGPGGNVAIKQPLHPDRWSIRPAQVSLLGDASYPSRRAKRAGCLMVAASPHVTKGQFRDFLAENGIESDLPGGFVGMVEAPLFAEKSLMRKLKEHALAAYFLKDAALVPATGQDGSRALAFRFPFVGT